MDWKTLRLALAWLGYWAGVAVVAALLAATTDHTRSDRDRRSASETPAVLDRPNISSTGP
jgi:hypothetical protein